MSNLSVKRQRANTNGDVAAIPYKPPDEYRKIIATFDEDTLRDLLLSAATSSPQVAALVVARRHAIIRAENANARGKDIVQESKMDIEAVGKTAPAKQAPKRKEAMVNIRDL